MNILLLVSQYLPHLGGVEVVVENLARQFKKAGHQVIIVAARAPRSLPPVEEIEGISVFRFYLGLPDKVSGSLFAFPIFCPLTLLRIFRLIRKEKIGIVHLHFADKAGFYALALRFLTKVSLVVGLHGNDVEKFPRESKFYRFVLRQLIKKAAAVTTNSQFIFEEAARIAPLIREKGKVLGNGVDFDEFEGIEPYESSRPYILGLGRLVPKKGFDLLIKAFEQIASDLPDYDLIIAGDGPEAERLKNMVQESPFGKRIKMVGEADREQAIGFFKGCTLFALPSRREPFGIVLLEAMVVGKAIVATSVGGVSEIVRDGYNGLLVESGNVSALSEGISRLLKDEKLRERVARNGRGFVKDFGWEKVSQRYLEVYHELKK